MIKDIRNYQYIKVLCKEFHEESAYCTIPYDYDAVIDNMKTIVELPTYYARMYVDSKGIVGGFLIGYLTKFTFSYLPVAIDYLFYVLTIEYSLLCVSASLRWKNYSGYKVKIIKTKFDFPVCKM